MLVAESITHLMVISNPVNGRDCGKWSSRRYRQSSSAVWRWDVVRCRKWRELVRVAR